VVSHHPYPQKSEILIDISYRLIEHEKASNAGNWQWLSCTAFFSQFFRVYSPVAFPQKWDKEGVFVRRYVPELANMLAKYIYEPWKAPVQD
jgi:cryptochrome